MKKGQIRSFVKHKETGEVGVVIANDSAGGVFRGHFDGWFGGTANGVPIVNQVLADDYDEIESPVGKLP